MNSPSGDDVSTQASARLLMLAPRPATSCRMFKPAPAKIFRPLSCRAVREACRPQPRAPGSLRLFRDPCRKRSPYRRRSSPFCAPIFPARCRAINRWWTRLGVKTRLLASSGGTPGLANLSKGRSPCGDLLDATEARYCDELRQPRPPAFLIYIDQGGNFTCGQGSPPKSGRQ
jgi:hypothetical protein